MLLESELALLSEVSDAKAPRLPLPTSFCLPRKRGVVPGFLTGTWGAGARPVEFSGCRCVVFLREFMEPRCPVELTSLPPPSTPALTCPSHRLASRTPGELDGAPCTPRKRANLPTTCPRPPLQTNTAFPSPGPLPGTHSSPHCPPAVLYYAGHSASGPPFLTEARAGCGGVSWGPAPV